jgi:outer membrane protein TolC
MKKTIEHEVLNAYERLLESLSACETERLNLKAADENNKIQEKSYELGLTQFKDVVDARIDAVTAKINLNYAHFRYALDRANLDYTVGRDPWKENIDVYPSKN